MRLEHRLRSQWASILLCAVLMLWGGPASAHSMYQSAVLIDFSGNTVRAELQLPVDRLSISFRQTVDNDHFAAERPALTSYVLAHVHPTASDGRPFAVQFVSMRIETVEKAPYLVVQLVFTPPANANADLFTLNYDVITHEIVTHVVLVSIRSDSKAHFQPKDPLLIGMIRGPRKSVVVDRMTIL